MNKKNRLAGRFLPSRVYARWKWTVRFGLSALPVILFIAGSIQLYLEPNRYQSTVVFEYLGKRPLPEVEALLKSRNVFNITADNLELSKRLGIDRDTTYDSLSGRIETSVDAASGMVELKVTDTGKEIARDLADDLAKSLEAYEIKLAKHTLQARLDALENSVDEAGDEAEILRQNLVRLISIRGEDSGDTIAKLDLDAARHHWENAQNRVLDGQARIQEARLELTNPGKWVVVHSSPVISQSPVGKKGDESLGIVILKALGIGLGYALVIPYLLELAFPRRSRAKAPLRDIEDWELGETDLVNG